MSVDDIDLEHTPFALIDKSDCHGDQSVGLCGEAEVVVRTLDIPQLRIGIIVVGIPAAAVRLVASPDPADVIGLRVDIQAISAVNRCLKVPVVEKDSVASVEDEILSR